MKFLKLLLSGLIVLVSISLLGLLSLYLVNSGLPNLPDINKCFTTKMYNVKLCPDSFSYLNYNEIPESLKYAILISEDASFYVHKGFDFHELKNSILQNLSKGKFFRGASTITQQLAKNMFLSSEKSLLRKAKEAILTYKLENKYSKNKILELYVNMVEFAKNTYGVQDASLFYFNKSARDLDLIESVFLAQILPNPKVLSKGFNEFKLSEHVKKKMALALDRMYFYKKINRHDYSIAKQQVEAFPNLTAFLPSPVPNDELIDEMKSLEEKMLDQDIKEWEE